MVNSEPDLATIAALISEPSRASILSALMGGEALPASELAYRSQITPQTASSHLAKLVDGNLIEVAKIGRHRYYSLKNEDVAKIIESLQVIAPEQKSIVKANPKVPQKLRYVRTCYDHLAGKLGVSVTQSLLEDGYLSEAEDAYLLTTNGEKLMETWQIDIAELQKKRRKFAYPCLDWSERRFHIAGSLGAAIKNVFFENEWVKHVPHSRALLVTKKGERILKENFNITLAK